MSKGSRLTLTSCALALALGASSHALAAADTVLATVNGQPITQASYDEFTEKNNLQGKAPKKKVLDEMISRQLVLQDAAAKKLEQRADIKAQLAQLRENFLLRSALREAITNNPVTDSELKTAYEAQVANMKSQEFKARHILVADEAKAKDLITQLDKGADFAELAKQHSTGPTGKKGGDLGWFGPNQMVPPFSSAVQTMDKGSYSKAPVKTQFGWHVIKLEDTREMAPPSLEEVKPKLQQLLQQQRVNSYLLNLRAKAEVTINP